MNQKLKISLFLLCCAFLTGKAQSDTIRYNLANVLELAKIESLPSFEAENLKQNALSNYKLFKSGLLPQVNAAINIPNYNRTFREITQPNGSIQFQSVEQNNSSVNLGITQVIPKTGGQIFLQSDLQRFDDFANSGKLYNGIPFRIGLFQPIGGFNSYKWQKRIEPLKLEESTRQYNVELEAINGRAIVYFFELLLSNVNLQIAEYNQAINENLLKIADERLELGKISESDILQLRFESNNAQKDFLKAKYRVENSAAALKTFLGKADTGTPVMLSVPDNLPNPEVTFEAALQHALKNRPELVRYEKELLESKRNEDRAKKENGINASIFASFGFARGSTQLEDIYLDPQREQQFGVQINIPLVDWGKRKTAVALAKTDTWLVQKRINQTKLDFENDIRQIVNLFNQLQEEIAIQKEAKDVARQRFEISRQRYILADISITELTIAQKEKDQAERDYIFSLRDYWLTFYELRRLTGYDFVNQTPIFN